MVAPGANHVERVAVVLAPEVRVLAPLPSSAAVVRLDARGDEDALLVGGIDDGGDAFADEDPCGVDAAGLHAAERGAARGVIGPPAPAGTGDEGVVVQDEAVSAYFELAEAETDAQGVEGRRLPWCGVEAELRIVQVRLVGVPERRRLPGLLDPDRPGGVGGDGDRCAFRDAIGREDRGELLAELMGGNADAEREGGGLVRAVGDGHIGNEDLVRNDTGFDANVLDMDGIAEFEDGGIQDSAVRAAVGKILVGIKIAVVEVQRDIVPAGAEEPGDVVVERCSVGRAEAPFDTVHGDGEGVGDVWEPEDG